MEINDLKCCGNCIHFNNYAKNQCMFIKINTKTVLSSSYCREGWTFDDMTAIERENEACEINNS